MYKSLSWAEKTDTLSKAEPNASMTGSICVQVIHRQTDRQIHRERLPPYHFCPVPQSEHRKETTVQQSTRHWTAFFMSLVDSRLKTLFLSLEYRVGWWVGYLTSQQQASVSQGRICSDNFTSCHTEIEVADPTFYLTQSQYTDTGPTSPSADPITPGAWQGSHWSANAEVTGMTRPRKNPGASGIRTRDLPLSRRTP